ncbi:Sec14p-like phosphatidylinositol transfer family protein [Thalictrum thalictroides]|uniref:Sec14p-like phosphatidylinositol transfer family protein n=1 Tax=Thalictrum thalictroides TaxID=46969 RepID=A0A7J6V0E2_THATH|nr:Sec14p-like phosphatidylinositol transfer family protein [Thalictrum thalictroides]
MSTSSNSNTNTNGMEKTQQTLLLTEMRKLVVKQGSSAEHYGDPMLLRFLITSSMDPTKAAKMWIKWKKWREEIAPLGYIPQSEILDQLGAKKFYLQAKASQQLVLLFSFSKTTSMFAPKD